MASGSGITPLSFRSLGSSVSHFGHVTEVVIVSSTALSVKGEFAVLETTCFPVDLVWLTLVVLERWP